jgi:hypothetical protein
MSFSPNQQTYQQPNQQQSTGFFGSSGLFGSTAEQLNPQTIMLITQQLQQQGVPQNVISNLNDVLTQVQMDGTEKISNVLKQNNLSPDLTSVILHKLNLVDLEDSMAHPGMRQPGMVHSGMGNSGMGQPGMGNSGMGQPGRSRSFYRPSTWFNNRGTRGGKMRRRTTYKMKGGRRRNRSHKMKGGSCKTR